MQKVVALSKFHQSYECNCQICYQEFNTEDKRPYIICANQHISCMKCLNQYLQKQREEERLPCHFCRQQIYQDKLIELRPLISLLHKVKKQKQQNEALVDKFNDSNQWKKNEVNEIVQAMTTIFIYKIQESDKNNTARMEEVKEQIRQKTNNHQLQSQSFYEQMRIWMRNMQIRNQQIFEQTRKIVSQNKKQGQENKEVISKLLKENKQISKSQDLQNGKINKILTQLQNLKVQTNQIVILNARLNEKLNQQKRNLMIQKNYNDQKQKTVQKKTSLENISMKIGKPKQNTDEKPQNKSGKGEQRHRTMRSYTAVILEQPISQVEGQHLDQKRDFKKQKMLNVPTKEEVKQKTNNQQMNFDSKKLNKKQLDSFLPRAIFSEKQQQISIKNVKKLPHQIKDTLRKINVPPRQQAMKKDDQQKQKNPLQKKHKVEWKRQLQLSFLNDQEENPMNSLRQSTVLPTSAKNFNDINKLGEDSSFRRSFGHKDLFSARNYSSNNKKQPKIDIFDQVQKQRKNKFISSIIEIYGKANRQQYQKFYQKYPLKNNEELIQLWSEQNQIDPKKKINKVKRKFQY